MAATFFVDLGLRPAAHPQRKGDVLGDREMREQRVALEHHADVALVRGHGEQRLALQQDVARESDPGSRR